MRLLRNAAEITSTLQTLFSHDVPKLALVAFVGKDGPGFLPPDVTDLEVICWPKAGGTHPEGVNALLAQHRVRFCDRLHSKVYWAQGRGMIVGSANLSRNALGAGGLDEYAVLLEEGLPTREELLAPIQQRLREVDAAAMEALRIEHRKYWQRNADTTDAASTATASRCRFADYLAQPMPARWKIATYEEALPPEEVKARIEAPLNELTGSGEFHNYNEVAAGTVAEGDFLLQVKTSKDGRRFLRRPKVDWLYVDKVINGIAVQLTPRHPSPPFDPDDAFRDAFCTVGNAREWEQIRDADHVVTDAFMRAVREAMSSAVTEA